VVDELADGDRRQRRRLEDRRAIAQDAVLYTFLFVIVALAVWMLVRMDERSERLFDLVASSRASSSACP
jgi:hypothetical protein